MKEFLIEACYDLLNTFSAFGPEYPSMYTYILILSA